MAWWVDPRRGVRREPEPSTTRPRRLPRHMRPPPPEEHEAQLAELRRLDRSMRATMQGPSSAARIEARLDEVRRGPVTAESLEETRRLGSLLADAKRRERGTIPPPSPGLPPSVSDGVRRPPQAPTPGMRRRVSTSQGDFIEGGE
jgi:hypothetical protein